jgi:prepilin-type N-terminal cleavage/methylation domain-containing protein/prepilin-type processing-associated H-X9-DG protein
MRTSRGFTLIEVTVVITIICILAAILFPVFARAREKARQTRCQTNLQQIGLALSIYARDHAGHFPPKNDDLTPLVGRYLPMEEVLRCPSAGPREREAPVAREDAGDNKIDAVPAYDYYYRAGFCDDDDPHTFLVCDTHLRRHNGGCGALFADGHAKWFKDPRQPGYGSAYGGVGNPLPLIVKERHLREQPPPTPGGVSP